MYCMDSHLLLFHAVVGASGQLLCFHMLLQNKENFPLCLNVFEHKSDSDRQVQLNLMLLHADGVAKLRCKAQNSMRERAEDSPACLALLCNITLLEENRGHLPIEFEQFHFF